MTPYFHREISGILHAALESMPVVVLSGMRQSGKSTLLQNEPGLRRRRYITLDDFAVLEAAQKDPETLLDSPEDLTIDEAQKCPELLVAIKRMVDRKRSAGKFLLSGSANFSLLKGVSESLAGRAVYYALQPFCKREKDRKTAAKPFITRFAAGAPLGRHGECAPITAADILTGGMPAVAVDKPKHPEIWFKGYQQTYVERDVRDLSRIFDLMTFHKLMQLAALRSGRICSVSELSRDVRVGVTTTARYLDLMEASYLLRKIPPFLGNTASRLIKSPKMYFADSGLACFLAGISNTEPLLQSSMYGAMFEAYVAQNLVSILDSHSPDTQLCYWNIQGRYEVDFIIESGNQCLAIEVKTGSRFHAGDFSGLKAFMAQTKNCFAGILAYNGREAVSVGDRLWAIPVSLLIS